VIEEAFEVLLDDHFFMGQELIGPILPDFGQGNGLGDKDLGR
jgi:hypothetical protein